MDTLFVIGFVVLLAGVLIYRRAGVDVIGSYLRRIPVSSIAKRPPRPDSRSGEQ